MFAPGGKHIGLRLRDPCRKCSVGEEPKDALYKTYGKRVFMGTAGKIMGRRTLGVMLDGHGF